MTNVSAEPLIERAATDWFLVDCSQVAWFVLLSLSFGSTVIELLLSKSGDQLESDSLCKSVIIYIEHVLAWAVSRSRHVEVANVRNDSAMKVATGETVQNTRGCQ